METENLNVKPIGNDKDHKSWVWTYFGKLESLDNNFDKCLDTSERYCSLCFKINNSLKKYGDGTSLDVLAYHLVNSHNLIKNNQEKNKIIIKNSNDKNNQINKQNSKKKLTQEELNNLITLFGISANLPFSIVENNSFINLVNQLTPNLTVPSRTLVSKKYLNDIYSSLYLKIVQLISNLENKVISICLDLWFCRPKKSSFIVFNSQFSIDKISYSVMLKFIEVEHPHTSDHLKLILNNLINEYNLQNKIIVYTTDEGNSFLFFLFNLIIKTNFY